MCILYSLQSSILNGLLYCVEKSWITNIREIYIPLILLYLFQLLNNSFWMMPPLKYIIRLHLFTINRVVYRIGKSYGKHTVIPVGSQRGGFEKTFVCPLSA